MLVCRIKHLNSPSIFEVEVGKHKLGQRETTESRHKVAKIFMHAGYSKLTHDNDIALIKLSTAISFTREVSPVCLPMRDVWGTMCVTTGWGKTHGASTCIFVHRVKSILPTGGIYCIHWEHFFMMYYYDVLIFNITIYSPVLTF